ncbi:MAG: hypothetical protein ACRD3O_12720, partial [Terriglobia bacterium]
TGHLDIYDNRATWEWTAASGWKQMPSEPQEHFVPLLPDPFRAPGSPPAGCMTPPPSSLVRDSLGRSWWVAEDALYEGVGGDCRIVLSGSSPQPFIDGRQLDRVLLDRRGNVFLGTQAPFSYVMLRSSVYDGKPQSSPAKHPGEP